MEEIVPGVFRILQKGRIHAFMPPVNIYAMPGRDGLIFDAGYGTRHAVAQLRRGLSQVAAVCRRRGLPCRFARVLPSHAHPDHFAGLAAISRFTGAEIWLTRKMADRIGSRLTYRNAYATDPTRPSGQIRKSSAGRWLTILESGSESLYEKLYGMYFVPRPDRIVSEREALTVNGRQWQVIATPGHSDDHIGLYDSDSGVLLGGDNVLRSVTTWLGPPGSDLAAYVRTLCLMAALPGLKLILGAHGSPVTDPRQRIADILEWRERRTRQVLDAVMEAGPGGIGAGRLVRQLYRGEGLGKWYMAEGWVMLTLDYLVESQRVRTIRNRGRLRFVRGDHAPEDRVLLPLVSPHERQVPSCRIHDPAHRIAGEKG
ncbi:MAG: MBL fold metallo-hydrolase [Desulfobacterales bacterium]|nr:MBL fold metallo-hydrolase [Desulfobacterales bacterium]